MKALLQWTLADPQDWHEFDLRTTGNARRAWDDLPARPVPADGQLGAQDNTLGHVMALNIQGVVFTGYDHYFLRPLTGDGIEVTAWNDDPGDFPPEERWAAVWTFLPPAPDPAYGGAMNTRQSRVIYLAGPWAGHTPGDTRTEVRAFGEFSVPAAARTRHGIWVADEKFREHAEKRSLRGWDEWVA